MIYGSKEYRESCDKETQAWIESKIKIIGSIPDNYFKAMCYFSMIECFAQEYSNANQG